MSVVDLERVATAMTRLGRFILLAAVARDVRDAWDALLAHEPLSQEVFEAMGNWFEVELLPAGNAGIALVQAAQSQRGLVVAMRTFAGNGDSIQGTAGAQGAQGVGFVGADELEELLQCRVVKRVHDAELWQTLTDRAAFRKASLAGKEAA